MSRRKTLSLLIVLVLVAASLALLAPSGDRHGTTEVAEPSVAHPPDSAASASTRTDPARGPEEPSAAPSLYRPEDTSEPTRASVSETPDAAKSEVVAKGSDDIWILGRVRDTAGGPISGAQVRAWTKGQDFLSSPSIRAGADGSFELRDVVPGNVTLYVRGDRTSDAQLEIGELPAGTVRTDVEVVLSRRLPIAGRVQWPDGRPAPGCEVACTYGQQRSRGRSFVRTTALCDSEGKFLLLDAGDGPVALMAAARSQETVESASMPWVACLDGVRPGTEGVILTLRPGAVLRGTVLDETGKPPASAMVIASPAQADLPEWSGLGQVVGRLDAGSGKFEIPGLHDGDWNVYAEGPGHAKSVTRRIAIPGDGLPLRLVLRSNAAVSGDLVDEFDNPVANARVYAWIPAGNPWESVFRVGSDVEVRSDPNGHFELDSVPSGRVQLQALADEGDRAGSLFLDLEPGESQSGVRLVLRPVGGPSRKK